VDQVPAVAQPVLASRGSGQPADDVAGHDGRCSGSGSGGQRWPQEAQTQQGGEAAQL
jgi:hypothetical protein